MNSVSALTEFSVHLQDAGDSMNVMAELLEEAEANLPNKNLRGAATNALAKLREAHEAISQLDSAVLAKARSLC